MLILSRRWLGQPAGGSVAGLPLALRTFGAPGWIPGAVGEGGLLR